MRGVSDDLLSAGDCDGEMWEGREGVAAWLDGEGGRDGLGSDAMGRVEGGDGSGLGGAGWVVPQAAMYRAAMYRLAICRAVLCRAAIYRIEHGVGGAAMRR